METNYGTFPLNFDAAETLANMAVEGRRRSYAEGELISLMKLLERGDVQRGDLLSGWAGAMGQTQFMPSTYLAYAVDFNADGEKDVWDNKGDALGSAANYLSVSGYNHDQPWGIEVMTHEGFDFSMADGQDRRMSTWIQAGLHPMNSQTFETGGADYAELWLPAGATGPKYLLFANFDVFKTYNRADSYALAVGLLWPTQLAAIRGRLRHGQPIWNRSQWLKSRLCSLALTRLGMMLAQLMALPDEAHAARCNASR